ncbi:MAG: hypothetical protein GVY30_06910, partial [Chloroflexi bacterium]|nr:hypothetical protein [Chloroflexota bacterium]
GVEHSRFELDVAADLGNRAYDRAQEIGLDPTSAYHLAVNEYLAGELTCECNGDGSCRVCRAAARQWRKVLIDSEGDEVEAPDELVDHKAGGFDEYEVWNR